MAEPKVPDDLSALLQQLRLQQANGKSPSEVTQAQVDLLLARIASLTDALRRTTDGGDAAASTRLLLADLAMVAAQLRGNTNDLGERLTHALDHAHAALESSVEKPAPRE